MKYIQNLKQGKSAGPDNIPAVILKDAADCICKPLTMIFNSSFRLGTFPDRWKIARITPIYKSGAKDDTNNYRPISILSVLSKLYEKIAHDQLIDFLQSNKKLTKYQFAFRKLHSTITSLIGVSDHWYSNIDNKKANFALFLDLKKSFDTVDHEILISKLAKYGVKGRENDWLKSYLKALYRIFVNKPILRDNVRFVSNETKDQWRTVITQLRSSRQIEIDATIGSSVSYLPWMNVPYLRCC